MAEEITHLDHIAPPYTVHLDQWTESDVPLCVTSIGHYREGLWFNQFQYGFDNYSLSLTLGGTAEKRLGSIVRELKRGDIAFCNNYEPAYIRTTSAEWDTIFLNIRGYDLKLYDRLWNGDGFEIIHVDSTSFFEEAFEKIDALLGRTDLAARLEVSCLISTLLSRILSMREDTLADLSGGPVWLQEAKRYISTHCTEDMRIEDVAARFYVDRSAFSRLFKKHTGKSPKEYQMYCRVDSAAILLRTTDKSISEIATETGFTSHSFFTQQFSRIYGGTPSEWRKIRIAEEDV